MIRARGHYLADSAGTPFLFLGENCWNLMFTATRDDVVLYLDDRAAKGFTAIMAPLVRRAGFNLRGQDMVSWEDAGRNASGKAPFLDMDPTRPNEGFFRHADWVIEQAIGRGLLMALMPTWGNFVGSLASSSGPIIFTPHNAAAYGAFLGRRYRGANVMWILGGDHHPNTDHALAVWRAMADGLDSGDGGTHAIAYHPSSGASSSRWLHDEPWLDINMMQTSTRYAPDSHNWILADYNRLPVKPTIDGETRYENSHTDFMAKRGPRVTSQRIRQTAYAALLSGAAGHTYGCRDVWSFHVPKDDGTTERDVDTHWRQALHYPGAYQFGLLGQVFGRFPWYKLVPDQAGKVVVDGAGGRARPNQDEQIFDILPFDPYAPAAVSDDGLYTLVYVPENRAISVNLAVLVGSLATARWFNPRNGTYHTIGRYPVPSVQSFTPPHTDPDWLLTIERAG